MHDSNEDKSNWSLAVRLFPFNSKKDNNNSIPSNNNNLLTNYIVFNVGNTNISFELEQNIFREYYEKRWNSRNTSENKKWYNNIVYFYYKIY